MLSSYDIQQKESWHNYFIISGYHVRRAVLYQYSLMQVEKRERKTSFGRNFDSHGPVFFLSLLFTHDTRKLFPSLFSFLLFLSPAAVCFKRFGQFINKSVYERDLMSKSDRNEVIYFPSHRKILRNAVEKLPVSRLRAKTYHDKFLYRWTSIIWFFQTIYAFILCIHNWCITFFFLYVLKLLLLNNWYYVVHHEYNWYYIIQWRCIVIYEPAGRRVYYILHANFQCQFVGNIQHCAYSRIFFYSEPRES